MAEVERIGDQLRRAFEGPAWHGPSLKEVLARVMPAQAARRPLPDAHTIWELVLHITVWEDVVRRRIEGENIHDVPDQQDWPPATDTRAAAWKKAVEALEEGHKKLRQVVAALSDEQLNEKAPGKKHSLYVEVHGAIQHDLYHAGQIALLKKARR